MNDRTFWFITAGIAIVAAGIFASGYAFSYLMADFTMSDTQAKAYCSTPVKVHMLGNVQEDDLWIAPQDTGKVDFVK
jgi:DNA-binding MurR/RpiR family transcriptional regulator